MKITVKRDKLIQAIEQRIEELKKEKEAAREKYRSKMQEYKQVMEEFFRAPDFDTKVLPLPPVFPNRYCFDAYNHEAALKRLRLSDSESVTLTERDSYSQYI